MHPKHLDYKNAEVLFIGEKSFPQEGAHEGTAEELNLLEEEDEERVAHLQGIYAASDVAWIWDPLLTAMAGTSGVFEELEAGKRDYGGIQTTWG